MLVLGEERLILEFLTINGFATSPISSSKISTLYHEPGVKELVSRFESPRKRSPFDNPVESAALIAQRLPELPNTHLSSAQSAEVFSRLGHGITVEFKHNSTTGSTADFDIEISERSLLGTHGGPRTIRRPWTGSRAMG